MKRWLVLIIAGTSGVFAFQATIHSQWIEDDLVITEEFLIDATHAGKLNARSIKYLLLIVFPETNKEGKLISNVELSGGAELGLLKNVLCSQHQRPLYHFAPTVFAFRFAKIWLWSFFLQENENVVEKIVRCRWSRPKNVERFTILRVILAQGPC